MVSGVKLHFSKILNFWGFWEHFWQGQNPGILRILELSQYFDSHFRVHRHRPESRQSLPIGWWILADFGFENDRISSTKSQDHNLTKGSKKMEKITKSNFFHFPTLRSQNVDDMQKISRAKLEVARVKTSYL